LKASFEVLIFDFRSSDGWWWWLFRWWRVFGRWSRTIREFL
jgi:hypothetical protein